MAGAVEPLDAEQVAVRVERARAHEAVLRRRSGDLRGWRMAGHLGADDDGPELAFAVDDLDPSARASTSTARTT